jgi:hypothetical protein
MRLCRELTTITVLSLALTLGTTGEAATQDSDPVAVGERVRVRTTSGMTHVGVVTARAPGAIELQGESGGLLSVPTASMSALEVGRQRSFAPVGFLVGAGVGALGGLVLCGAKEENCTWYNFNGTSKDLSGGILASLAVAGAVAGALIGRGIKTDRWEAVPLERLRVSLAPQGDGGLAFGISARF